MREIKFRAWININKRFIDHNNLEISLKNINKHKHNQHMFYEQYTGLHDKNGKEIYEGDILNSQNDGSDGCDVWDYDTHNNLIVRWSNKYYCFIGLPDFDTDESVHSLKYIEVIGNIHENPELMR